MAIQLTDSIDLDATPQEALELVIDLETYRRCDPKILKVRDQSPVDADGNTTARIIGSLWILPPAPDTQLMHVDRWRSITITGAPGVPARLLFAFTGRFEAEPIEGGTRLTHSYDIRFRRPLSALLDERVGAWLAGELPQEMQRIAAHLGTAAP